jgi:O-antigen/teichoic acid export membrane protein
LLSKEQTGNLTGSLATRGLGALCLHIGATGLYFVISVLLARLWGAAGYGAYAYALAWVTFLQVPAAVGLDRLFIRNVASYQAQGAWGSIAGLLRWANHLVLLTSLGLMLFAAIVSWVLASHFDQQTLSTFQLALILLPPTVLMGLRGAAMRGLHHVVVGQLPETLIQPILFIALVGSVYLLIEEAFTPPIGMALRLIATTMTFFIGGRLLQRALPDAVRDAPPTYQTAAWLRSALPLLLVAGLGVISSRTDTLMLGAIRGVEAVGIYNVAARAADFVTFFLAANTPLGPTIAGLYATGDTKLFQNLVTRSARLTSLMALPVAVGFIVFGRWYLSLFGADFIHAHGALALLSAAQLINVAMGPVSLLLVMTGHERDAVMALVISAISNVILNGVLIPQWGLEGAAAATASSTILWNVLMAKSVYRRLGIYCPALGKVAVRSSA